MPVRVWPAFRSYAHLTDSSSQVYLLLLASSFLSDSDRAQAESPTVNEEYGGRCMLLQATSAAAQATPVVYTPLADGTHASDWFRLTVRGQQATVLDLVHFISPTSTTPPSSSSPSSASSSTRSSLPSSSFSSSNSSSGFPDMLLGDGVPSPLQTVLCAPQEVPDDDTVVLIDEDESLGMAGAIMKYALPRCESCIADCGHCCALAVL